MSRASLRLWKILNDLQGVLQEVLWQHLKQADKAIGLLGQEMVRLSMPHIGKCPFRNDIPICLHQALSQGYEQTSCGLNFLHRHLPAHRPNGAVPSDY